MNNPTITITKDDQKGITVRIGDHYSDHLGWDEALSYVAFALVHGDFSKLHPYLKTKEQWHAYECYLAGIRQNRLSDTERQITEHAST